MDFHIKIEDESFQAPLKDAVARAIQSVIHIEADKFVRGYNKQISDSVLAYLNKRLTDEKIKSDIDIAVKRIIEEKLRYDRTEE